MFKKYKGEDRKRFHHTPHAARPDGDNLEKFLNDALSGVVWKDDAQISWILRSKTNTEAEEGYTVLYVRELSDTFTDYRAILEDIEEEIWPLK